VSGYRAAVSLSPVHTGDYMYSHRKRRLSPNLATIVASEDRALAYRAGYIKQLIGHVAYRRHSIGTDITLCVSVLFNLSLGNI